MNCMVHVTVLKFAGAFATTSLFCNWFLDFFPPLKNQNSKSRIEYDYSVKIFCEYFHRVIIVSHSFKCQKLKLFLADGGKPWLMTELEGVIESEVKEITLLLCL